MKRRFRASAIAAPAVKAGWFEVIWAAALIALVAAALAGCAPAGGASFAERWAPAAAVMGPEPRASMAACSWVERCRVAEVM